METFFASHQSDPYYKWGYIAFGVDGNKAMAYINSGSTDQPIFSDAAAMQTALGLQRSVPDAGCTPYLTALSLAKAAIQTDMKNNPDQDSIYNVFFMSDGFPNDANAAVACGSTTPVTNSPTDPYLMKVQDVLSLSPNKIFLSTAYYATAANDPTRDAASGLAAMARVGKGKFVDLDSAGSINFDDLKLGPQPQSLILKRMVAYNLNAAFCSDGTIDADSDADGICDKDEIYYNTKFAPYLKGRKFDPQNRNSIDPNFSDLFSYKLGVLPTGTGIPKCLAAAATGDFELLNQCEKLVLEDKNANGPTPQWTDEMRGIGGGTADPLNPDSDGDGFIDLIEFFTFGIPSAAVNYQNIFDRYAGGITAETIMAEHRHPMRPQVYDSSSYDGKVIYNGIDDNGQNCYSYKQTQLQLYHTLPVTQTQVSGLPSLVHDTDENLILLYYLIVPDNDPNGKGYYYYSVQKRNFSEQGSEVHLDMDHFKMYQVPSQRSASP